MWGLSGNPLPQAHQPPVLVCLRVGATKVPPGGGGGGLAGTPRLPGSPYAPRRRGAENFEASILLAPKGPKQNVGCQP